MPMTREDGDFHDSRTASTSCCGGDGRPRADAPQWRGEAVVADMLLLRLSRRAPDATATRMMTPWIAFSHCGCDAEEDQCRPDRAEQQRRRAACRAACRARRRWPRRRPPRRRSPAAPGRSPALGSTSANRTAFSSAARPGERPHQDEDAEDDAAGRMPASRAASASEPTA